nr:hypothetical protein CFP56_20456 [Quercus suber]
MALTPDRSCALQQANCLENERQFTDKASLLQPLRIADGASAAEVRDVDGQQLGYRTVPPEMAGCPRPHTSVQGEVMLSSCRASSLRNDAQAANTRNQPPSPSSDSWLIPELANNLRQLKGAAWRHGCS